MSIEVLGLSAGYRDRSVLHDVSFCINDGALMSVLGPNGVGKSTLFKCMLGLIRDYKGEIKIDGEAAHTLSQREIARRIAYIPQNHQDAFSYTVLEMVLMGAAHKISMFSQPKKADEGEALAALERVGAEALAQRSFNLLSGGERQLVLIARALMQKSRTLIMDEPTASLDYGNQLRVLELVSSLAHEGFCIIISTHDPITALNFSDAVLALTNGRILALGSPNDVLNAQLVKKLYGVDTAFISTEHGTALLPTRM